ncbi:PAS/PAC sensor signal transduction histidine kinase [Desulfovibrio sp. X2]|uniref:two-component system sensor histidine kinase NtrB n=1 Tax=Desulfovibrio sp. X2 TaxID=941449 RepID=UPI000358BD90|nr:ATP-binding protein [Desulfovibrio sp. X2]EPR40871.1 PAS/PAC sensor signal transduction histidine kinase [Desulfovibrio sp. X2]
MAADDSRNGNFCLWETEDWGFELGIVGTGPGFLTILNIIRSKDSSEFLPPMRLRAVARAGMLESPKLDVARSMGAPVYETPEEMLAAHPQINLVLELTGSAGNIRLLRSRLPTSVSLIDHGAAIFLCSLHNMLEISRHRQFALTSQRALMQAIIDEVHDDILLLDKERRVVDLNQNVAARMGRSKEELIGRPCTEIQLTNDGDGRTFCTDPDEACPFGVTLRSKQKAEAMLTRVDAEGRLRYFRVYSYPILDRHGDLSHVLIMRRDITERTQRERSAQQTEKLAVIGEMSTYLAHEIRNPLFAIGGFVNSLLRSPNLSESEVEKVKIIAEETKRLDHLLKSILGFVRTEQRPRETTDLAAAARETAELMRIGYCHEGFDLTLEETGVLPRVRGEAETIKQCLINLIKNSVEAMPGGGHVVVETGFDGLMAHASVRDDGPGIAPSEMDKVFSPFYSTKEQGYGLGLAMIKKIVEEAGGRVELVSREGEGTTVTLFFQPELAAGEAAKTETPDSGVDVAEHRTNNKDK